MHFDAKHICEQGLSLTSCKYKSMRSGVVDDDVCSARSLSDTPGAEEGTHGRAPVPARPSFAGCATLTPPSARNSKPAVRGVPRFLKAGVAPERGDVAPVLAHDDELGVEAALP